MLPSCGCFAHSHSNVSKNVYRDLLFKQGAKEEATKENESE